MLCACMPQVVERFTAHYVFALGLSRFMSCAHWILQVCTQTVLYVTVTLAVVHHFLISHSMPTRRDVGVCGLHAVCTFLLLATHRLLRAFHGLSVP